VSSDDVASGIGGEEGKGEREEIFRYRSSLCYYFRQSPRIKKVGRGGGKQERGCITRPKRPFPRFGTGCERGGEKGKRKKKKGDKVVFNDPSAAVDHLSMVLCPEKLKGEKKGERRKKGRVDFNTWTSHLLCRHC